MKTYRSQFKEIERMRQKKRAEMGLRVWEGLHKALSLDVYKGNLLFDLPKENENNKSIH